MKLRRAVGFAIAGIGATAAANRVLQVRAGRLDPPLEGEHHTYRWRGMDVAYTGAGDPDDPTVVLLHGVSAAASSHEFADVFEALADDYHVIAPDLPGFGQSDRPALRYSAPLYEDFVADFLGEFDEPAVIATGLTGAYAAAATRECELSHLTLICPTTHATPSAQPWARELLRTPLLGTALFYLIVSKPSIRYFDLEFGLDETAHLSEDMVDYQWRTAHQPGARFQHAAFVGGDLDSEIDLEEVLADADVPVTLVWGRDAEATPLRDGQALADAADCNLAVFDNAKMLPHVEYPDGFVETFHEELSGQD